MTGESDFSQKRPAVPDASLAQAIVVVNAALRQHGTEATRILFDHYRLRRGEAQDAIVLAFIGEAVTAQAMRAVRPDSDAQATLNQLDVERAALDRLRRDRPRSAP